MVSGLDPPPSTSIWRAAGRPALACDAGVAMMLVLDISKAQVRNEVGWQQGP